MSTHPEGTTMFTLRSSHQIENKTAVEPAVVVKLAAIRAKAGDLHWRSHWAARHCPSIKARWHCGQSSPVGFLQLLFKLLMIHKKAVWSQPQFNITHARVLDDKWGLLAMFMFGTHADTSFFRIPPFFPQDWGDLSAVHHKLSIYSCTLSKKLLMFSHAHWTTATHGCHFTVPYCFAVCLAISSQPSESGSYVVLAYIQHIFVYIFVFI